MVNQRTTLEIALTTSRWMLHWTVTEIYQSLRVETDLHPHCSAVEETLVVHRDCHGDEAREDAGAFRVPRDAREERSEHGVAHIVLRRHVEKLIQRVQQPHVLIRREFLQQR